MEALNQWIKAALLGSSRSDVRALRATLPEEMQGLLEQQGYESPEEELMYLLSVAVPYYKLAINPVVAQQIGSPAPLEALDYCSPPFADLLRKLLTQPQLFLLQMWAKKCGEAQKLAPPDLIPECFHLARKHPELQFSLLLILGERGEWLAQQHPDWQQCILAVEEAWETGTSSLRKIAFRTIRAENPARAWQLLETSWKEGSAAERAYFFQEIKDYLGAEHLPFLQSLLTDRSKIVQKAAILKLCHTPGSEYHLALQTLAKRALRVEAKGLWGFRSNQVSLEIQPIPAILVEGLGLSLESLSKQFSDEAYQWKELLEFLPISCWEQQKEMSAQEILTQFTTDKSLQKYAPSLLQSIAYSNNSQWAEAYFETVASQETTTKSWLALGNDILEVLEQKALQRLFAKEKLDWLSFSRISLLGRIQEPWGLSFSHTALRHLQKTYMAGGIPYQQLEELAALAEWIAPEILTALDQYLPPANERKESWRNALALLGENLRYKQQIMELTA